MFATSAFVSRTTFHPYWVNTSSLRQSASRCDSLWLSPSISTTTFARPQAKSAMCPRIGCCRRNLKPPSRAARNCDHTILSGQVASCRNCRERSMSFSGRFLVAPHRTPSPIIRQDQDDGEGVIGARWLIRLLHLRFLRRGRLCLLEGTFSPTPHPALSPGWGRGSWECGDSSLLSLSGIHPARLHNAYGLCEWLRKTHCCSARPSEQQ